MHPKRSHETAGQELAFGQAVVLLPAQLCSLHSLKRPALLIAPYVSRILWWVNTLLLAAELREKLSPKHRSVDIFRSTWWWVLVESSHLWWSPVHDKHCLPCFKC